MNFTLPNHCLGKALIKKFQNNYQLHHLLFSWVPERRTIIAIFMKEVWFVVVLNRQYDTEKNVFTTAKHFQILCNILAIKFPKNGLLFQNKCSPNSFRSWPNIFDGAFFYKQLTTLSCELFLEKALFQMFDRLLSMPPHSVSESRV